MPELRDGELTLQSPPSHSIVTNDPFFILFPLFPPVQFPGRVPVIVEKAARSDVPEIDKQKFLVPGDLTLGQLCFVLRKRLSLPPEKGLFLFIGSSLPTTGALLREIYAASADADGFLYVQYSGESTFGGDEQEQEQVQASLESSSARETEAA